MRNGKGFTLVELMVSISITSILATLSVTKLDGFLAEMRVDNEISQLHRLLLSARNLAISSGENVTVCPLNTANTCNTEWHNEISVFIDRNNNQQLDVSNQELIFKVKDPITLSDQLIYGKTRNKVVYKPTGQLSGLTNGTFRYCPKNYKDKSRGIIIARSGRLYTSSDIDNDGKDENRSLKEMSCD